MSESDQRASEAVLRFDNLHKSYGDIVALSGVSLEVRQGEVFGLLGPNGAGKTSLIRILMDIIRADSGSIELFGKPYDRDDLDRVGYLPEERGLYTKHKVMDVMVYSGTLKGLSRAEARARSTAWLDKIELPQVAQWRVERMSKGMSQKVQIATTLMAEPELIVLDEPFTGLDPLNVRLVQKFILERKRAGLMTILSTHRMNMVEALCDRVGLIHGGRLMVYGEVPQIRQDYSLPEVKVGANSEPPPLDGVREINRLDDGCWRLLLDEGVEPAELLRRLISSGLVVHEFQRLLAPMEDIFIRVVDREAA